MDRRNYFQIINQSLSVFLIRFKQVCLHIRFSALCGILYFISAGISHAPANEKKKFTKFVANPGMTRGSPKPLSSS